MADHSGAGDSFGAGVAALIPARIGSTRLPRKALADLGGEPMVVRVWRAVVACPRFEQVKVVTDADEIESAVRAAGGEVVRVDAPCRSGTERVARAAAALDARWIVNVQGDMPGLANEHLDALVDLLEAGAELATIAAPLEPARRDAASVVKVVSDARGRAMYFSRAPIPGALHVGLYGFRRATLLRLLDLPRSALAEAEDLEQLDWLHAGLEVQVGVVRTAPLAVDTPADLERARALFARS